MPAAGGTELDQKSPNWDASRSGLHGGSSKDITGLGSGWLRAGEGLDDPRSAHQLERESVCGRSFQGDLSGDSRSHSCCKW